MFLAIFLFSGNYLQAEDNYMTVSSFSTWIGDQDESVKRNISIASAKLNNFTIQPKSTFSFNEIVGEASSVNGYLNGRVMYRDEIRYEPGGGLCQVSSTLYNALLQAGLNIVERNRHYQPVTYVPLGLDATIKYGKKDLKMYNPYSFPIRIEVAINAKSLTFYIKSLNTLPAVYEVRTEEEEEEIPLNSDDMANVRSAISVYVYRAKVVGGKCTETALLYKDYYPPVRIK